MHSLRGDDPAILDWLRDLGLPEQGVYEVQIVITANQPVSVEVQYLPTFEQVRKLAQKLRRFHLVPAEE